MQHQGNAPVHQSGRVRPPERLLDAQREHRVREGLLTPALAAQEILDLVD